MNKEKILDKLNDIIEMIETDCKVTGWYGMSEEVKKYAYNIRLELVDLHEEISNSN